MHGFLSLAKDIITFMHSKQYFATIFEIDCTHTQKKVRHRICSFKEIRLQQRIMFKIKSKILELCDILLYCILFRSHLIVI